MRLTWIGHSTVLLELDGVRFLTDPLLRGKVFHVRRVAPRAVLAEEPDVVLISHVHYDHLDLPSLRRIGRDTPVVAPAGAARFLRGFSSVQEVRVGDEIPIGSVTIEVTPAEHEAHRIVGGTIPAVGFVIRGSEDVYFVGDTDLFDGMRDAGPVDLAVLPIAGWGPRIPAGHMDPLRAARALQLLRPKVAVPVHWGTYLRMRMPRDEATLRAPAAAFVEHARELAPEVDVRVLEVGASLELPVRERVA